MTARILRLPSGGEVELTPEDGYMTAATGAADATMRDGGAWEGLPHDPEPSATELWLDVHTTADDSAGIWLKRWRNHEILLRTPLRWALEAIETGLSGAADRLQLMASVYGKNPVAEEVFYGVRQVPLRSPTLPPATHTNAYVIGHDRLIIVDPATLDGTERDKLVAYVRDLAIPVQEIVLTHHHGDHVCAATWLAEALNVRIAAHPITADLLQGDVAISRTIDEGDVFDLGPDLRFVVQFTPGHAPGHIVLRHERALICGDMVAAVGTIIVDPSEGDMARYIAELRRLMEPDPGVVFAAHGPPIPKGKARLAFYVAHRLKREAKVFAALEKLGPCDAADLLPLAYDDTPRALHPLAVRACLAHLDKLVHDRRAQNLTDVGQSVYEAYPFADNVGGGDSHEEN